MSFPVTTLTIWNPIVQETKADELPVSRIYEMAEYMEQMGKTDNVPSIQHVSPEELRVVRNWSSREAAQEWLDFITTYDPVHVAIT